MNTHKFHKISSFAFILLFVLCINLQHASAQWQLSGTFGAAIHSFAVSGTNIFAGLQPKGVYISTDTGISWNAVNTGLTDSLIIDLAAKGTFIYAGTPSGVFLSTNQGLNWSSVSNGLPYNNFVSLGVSDSNIFVGTSVTFGGDTGKIFLSNNNGANWSEALGTNIYGTFMCFASNGSNVFAGSMNGIFYSNNNGLDWKRSGYKCKVKSLIIIDTILLVGSGAGIYISYDKGDNLKLVQSNVYAREFVVIVTKIFVGSHRGVWFSTDLGVTWNEANDGLPLNTGITSVAINGTMLFAASNNGQIWKRPLSEFTSSSSVEIEKSISIALSPNPLTSHTYLNIDLKQKIQNAELEIFDLYGRMVIKVENINSNRILVERNGLPSGMYMFRFRNENGAIAHGKLIIQ